MWYLIVGVYSLFWAGEKAVNMGTSIKKAYDYYINHYTIAGSRRYREKLRMQKI